VCPKSRNQPVENHDSASLRACLVDGDADQFDRARRTRRRSLLLSVLLQIAMLAGLVLVPLLSKPPRIALANVMPVPPYHHATPPEHTTVRQPHVLRNREFTFCLMCPPVVTRSHMESTVSGRPDDNPEIGRDLGPGPECSGCTELIGKTDVRPLVPSVPTPSVVRIAHLDPAMLIHRVEPIFPTLARQAGREGRVELHALIGPNGTIQSLQVLEGDPMFYPSALDAVRQWRYRPTILNGRPVEVDTHITVIYKLNR
jgi:periplasmic protein TonB